MKLNNIPVKNPLKKVVFFNYQSYLSSESRKYNIILYIINLSIILFFIGIV